MRTDITSPRVDFFPGAVHNDSRKLEKLEFDAFAIALPRQHFHRSNIRFPFRTVPLDEMVTCEGNNLFLRISS